MEMGEREVTAFLSDLAQQRNVSASTQNQALSALLFLYRHVLARDLGELHGLVWAKRSIHVPVVLTRDEVTVVLGELAGQEWLVCRRTPLPESLAQPLTAHLVEVRRLHVSDCAAGYGRVSLPDALAMKYPNAATEWRWQFVFPAGRICRDIRWGPPSRYHLHESAIQRAVTEAVKRTGLSKRASCHTFRHSFATHLRSFSATGM